MEVGLGQGDSVLDGIPAPRPRVSRRQREMYCGHARLCLSCVCLSVCLSIRGRMPTLFHGPGCNFEEW